jgi:hypothetical protein
MRRPLLGLLGPSVQEELPEELTPVEAELARSERRRLAGRLAVLGAALLGLLLWLTGRRVWRG